MSDRFVGGSDTIGTAKEFYSARGHYIVSPPGLKSADIIAGYSVKERIGAGGYGEVWSAEAPGGLDKAIKFVYGYLAEERAARELKALNRIKEVRHPFLLSLERIEVIDGQLVIITELAEASLKDRFEQCKKEGLAGIPREELLVYIRDAADALDYMGKMYSLQHLDVKPENLLIVGGRVKVADFGLVKDIHETNISMMGGLTPTYSPPEILDGQPTFFSDQYSLAIVFQEMLTGTLPFPGKTASQLANQHLHAQPRLAALDRRDRETVGRALQKDPDKRFENCRAMADCLLDPTKPNAAVEPDKAPQGQPAADTSTAETDTTGSAERIANKPDSTDEIRAGEGLNTATIVLQGSPSQADVEAPAASDVPSDDAESLGPTSVRLSQPASADVKVVHLAPLDVAPGKASLRPALLLGIGGTAARTFRHLRRRLHGRFGDLDEIPSIEMLLLDTDRKTMVSAIEGDESVALGHRQTMVMPLLRPEDYRNQSGRFLKWLSRRWLYNIPRSLNTEGLRPLGRLALVDHARELSAKLQAILTDMTSQDALAKSLKTTGMEIPDAAPRVFLVSSIAGGTGSGMVLDVAFAVRKALADAGHGDQGVCGLLTHSTGRNPNEVDLAIANTYACLSELQHYATTSYPGDAACGLPAFADGAPFHNTYLLHLGDDLSDAQFDRATDSLAEYLYLSTATAGGEFLDACRQRELTSTRPPGAGVDLRTFGLSQIGCTHGAIPPRAAEVIAKRVVERWLDDSDRSGASTPTEPGSLSTNNPTNDDDSGTSRGTDSPPDEAPSADEMLGNTQLCDLASQYAEDHGFPLERMVQWVDDLFEQELGTTIEAHFDDLVRQTFNVRASRPKTGMVEAVDAVLGPLDDESRPSERLPSRLLTTIDAQIRQHLQEQGIELHDWILQLVDDSRLGIHGARPAADWFVEYVEDLRGRIADALELVRRQLAGLAESRTPQVGRASRIVRFALGRRSQKAEDDPQYWNDYCRLRIRWTILARIEKSFDRLEAQVAPLPAEIAVLRRRLTGIGLDFESTFSWEELAVADGPRSNTPDEFRVALVETLQSRVSTLAEQVDRELRLGGLLEAGGLCALLGERDEGVRLLTVLLRRTARMRIHRVVREMDLLDHLFLTRRGVRKMSPELHDCLETAKPPLLICGGAKRLLLVAPAGSDPKRLQDEIAEEFEESSSVVFDLEGDIVVCYEAEQMPLAMVASAIAEQRPDIIEAASRLHTRADVRWKPL